MHIKLRDRVDKWTKPFIFQWFSTDDPDYVFIFICFAVFARPRRYESQWRGSSFAREGTPALYLMVGSTQSLTLTRASVETDVPLAHRVVLYRIQWGKLHHPPRVGRSIWPMHLAGSAFRQKRDPDGR